MAIVCYACGSDVGARERIGRRDRCEHCGVELHSCRQCRFHDPRAYNACTEPQAERKRATQIAMPYHWKEGTFVAYGQYGYPDYPDGELRTTAP